MRARFFMVASGTLILAGAAPPLPPQYLPIVGGAGGSGYTRSCGAGNVLVGLQFRQGFVVDAIGVMCRPVSPSGALGTISSTGSLAGGSGGTYGTVACPSGKVVTGARIAYGSFVDGIALSCSTWNGSTRQFATDGTFAHRLYIARDDGVWSARTTTQHCESRAQPVNAIRGRASGVVDALGLICDEP